MDKNENEADRQVIRELVSRQFESLSWAQGRPARWAEFAADFLPEASLFPAARPVKRVAVSSFVDRMKSQAGSKMLEFEERLLGIDVQVFGNVAVALAACEQIENGTIPQRAVEALLLVKEQEGWRIAAQAWDKEGTDTPIPPALLE